MYLQGWFQNLKPLQQNHWAIPVGMLSAGRAAVVTLPGCVYVAGFNLPDSRSVYVPLTSFPIRLGALSPGCVAPGCLLPDRVGTGQLEFEGPFGYHPAEWSRVCQTPVSLPGCRLCNPLPGPSLPQSQITQGHFRMLVALSQSQPLGRGGSGLHSRSLAPTPALSSGHPCTTESLSPSEKEGGD